jgi:hypothetical protein
LATLPSARPKKSADVAGGPAQAGNLPQAFRDYAAEIAQREAELAQLAPDVRESRKSEIKRRHLGFYLAKPSE